jgi:biofilm PGA synthesis N-glycosyltransferase PgaC
MRTSGKSGLTVLVPAYNEASTIADTIRSIQDQIVPADEILVIDDCSSDNTADIARSLGVTVMQPPKNTGSKAGAQNFALHHGHRCGYHTCTRRHPEASSCT